MHTAGFEPGTFQAGDEHSTNCTFSTVLAQVKNLEMFLSSCWLNLDNILAVSRKTDLEIFLAILLKLFLAIARHFGKLFFLAIARTFTSHN